MGYTKARPKQDRIWQLQGLVLATAVLVAERVPKKTRPTLSCILYIFRRQLLVLQLQSWLYGGFHVSPVRKQGIA